MLRFRDKAYGPIAAKIVALEGINGRKIQEAIRIYFHGVYRKTRGKRPSMPSSSHTFSTNPRKAFEMAKAYILDYHPLAGETITNASKQAKSLSQATNLPISFAFNAVRVSTNGATVQEMETFYWTESRKRRKEYEDSQEYLEYLEGVEKELQDNRFALKRAMLALPQVDFSNEDSVLSWCLLYNAGGELIDNDDERQLNRNSIVSWFRAYGYDVEVRPMPDWLFRTMPIQYRKRHVIHQFVSSIKYVGCFCTGSTYLLIDALNLHEPE